MNINYNDNTFNVLHITLSCFPQGGNDRFLLLPQWGKVGMGVNRNKKD